MSLAANLERLPPRPGLIAWAWAKTKMGERLPDRWEDRGWWVRMLRREGFSRYFSAAPRPSAPMLLFRGAPAEHAAGLAWTPNPVVATMYARCERQPGGMLGSYLEPPPGELWATWADPAAMLAILHTQSGVANRFDEIEVLRDPDALDIMPARFTVADVVQSDRQDLACRACGAWAVGEHDCSARPADEEVGQLEPIASPPRMVTSLASRAGHGEILSLLVFTMNEAAKLPEGTRTSVMVEAFGPDLAESRKRLRNFAEAIGDRWYCSRRATAAVWGHNYEVMPATAAVYAVSCAKREAKAGRKPLTRSGDRLHDFAHDHLDSEFTNYPPDVLDVAHACVNVLLYTQAAQLDRDPYADRHWWAERLREWPYLRNYQPAAPPAGEPLRLFRDAPEDRADGATWTESREHAELSGEPVWEATFPAGAILAGFPARSTLAQCYIVDPAAVAAATPVRVAQ